MSEHDNGESIGVRELGLILILLAWIIGSMVYMLGGKVCLLSC